MSLRRGWQQCGICLTERAGWMRIHGGNSLCSAFQQHLLARRITTLKLQVTTEMQFAPACANHTAGLVLMYNAANWHYLYITADDAGNPEVCVSTCEDNELTDHAVVKLPEGQNTYHLSAHVDGATLQFSIAINGNEKQMIGPELDMRILSDEHVQGNGFTSAMVGICCQDL